VQDPTVNPLTGVGAGSGGLYGNASLVAGHITSMIQAFERNGVAHILAEPTVTAISGESARFTAGGSVPVATGSSVSKDASGSLTCTFTTTLQNYGVTLNFTPTVLSEGRISLHLATEVSEPDTLHTAQTVCANQTGFRTRTNETTVELPSGGSIVTAGLIQQTNKQAIAGLPGLMNLPILGALFRSRDYQREETELMIIVTPFITKVLGPDQIQRPDDGLVDATDPQSWFLGRLNRVYSTADNPELIHNFKGHVGFIND
jgi:pilus assembly protein CpaC